MPAIPVSAKANPVGLFAKLEAKGPSTVFTISNPV